MKPEDHERFVKLYASSQLVKPEDVGHVIAGLSIGAKPELSGQFINWNDETIKEFQRQN